uniref:FAD/NAD(P)-binding domain-containing protein n=1 Tax=Homalodisca liturata TaxID=320908 RepID=A0A1B6I5I8_9HEMI
MRDLNGCAHSTMSSDAIYKEVVVVGNGPSGLGLSYMLAGNWPYYNNLAHPDEMLTARLHSSRHTRSLIHQDLKFLSQGLEGRSNNPVSVLVDCLTHPGADAGLDTPQLLKWRPHADKAVDHIVLGKGPPGGAWQAMDGNVLTISLNSWMELPGLEFRRWEARNGSPVTSTRRVPVASVAAYYRDYVRLMRLSKYFRSGVVVTSVRPIGGLASQPGEIDSEVETATCHCHCHCHMSARWAVEGYDTVTNAPFLYVCRSVVLATGSTDLHNFLNVPGELSHPSWVFHDLADFEKALIELVKENPGIKEGYRTVDPVCIVGAGLSAADAVLSSRFHSLPIIHIFRRAEVSPERTLPENMYPEYHKVHQMMRSGGEGYPEYSAFPQHKVVDISAGDGKKVTTVSPSGLQVVHQVSLMAVLIGSRPDLSFLPPEFQDGQTLAVDPERTLDCRSNPISVDPWSHSVSGAPVGLYAMGPLSGDNFVRFLLGGALAIASDIYSERKELSPPHCI